MNSIELNNSFNENKVNVRASNKFQLKHLFKPLIKYLKKNKNQQPTTSSIPQVQEEYFCDDCEMRDNEKNEILEGLQSLCKVVPVHFIQTQEGTFFWTSGTQFDEITYEKSMTTNQIAELEVRSRCDRWAQA